MSSPFATKLSTARGPAYWRSLDELAQSPEFLERLHREFPARFTGLTTRPSNVAGIGGQTPFNTYSLPSLQLDIGSATVQLTNVPVWPPFDTTADKIYGSLGRDLAHSSQRFTIDFLAMRFTLADPAK